MLLETLDRRGAERVARELIVYRVLGHVNVHSRHGRAPFRDRGERGLRHRETGVQAEHAPDSRIVGVRIHEAEVFLDSQCRALRPVSVRHLIAQHARDSGVRQSAGQQVEAAVDAGRRRVVIEYRRASPAYAVCRGQQSGQTDRVRVEGSIESPPQPVQDLGEVSHLDPWIETAGEGRIEVVVQVHESGEDEAATSVEIPSGRVGLSNLRLRPHPHDPLFLPGHGTACDHGRILPSGDQVSVSEHDLLTHGVTLVSRFTRWPNPAGPRNSAPPEPRPNTRVPRTKVEVTRPARVLPSIGV